MKIEIWGQYEDNDPELFTIFEYSDDDFSFEDEAQEEVENLHLFYGDPWEFWYEVF